VSQRKVAEKVVGALLEAAEELYRAKAPAAGGAAAPAR
jgi:hypothetical protein